jgi:hypothetical protein
VIFVSYSWRDRCDVEVLCARLRARQASYWLDSERLDMGRPLDSQIRAGLKVATAVILVDTVASRASTWVALERALATHLAKPIILAEPADFYTAALPAA